MALQKLLILHTLFFFSSLFFLKKKKISLSSNVRGLERRGFLCPSPTQTSIIHLAHLIFMRASINSVLWNHFSSLFFFFFSPSFFSLLYSAVLFGYLDVSFLKANLNIYILSQLVIWTSCTTSTSSSSSSSYVGVCDQVVVLLVNMCLQLIGENGQLW